MIVKQYLVLSMYLYVDTRPYPLDRTASSSLQPFKVILAPRGHAEIILVADFPECGYALQPTSVRLHTHIQLKRSTCCGTTNSPTLGVLLRDNRPTITTKNRRYHGPLWAISPCMAIHIMAYDSSGACPVQVQQRYVNHHSTYLPVLGAGIWA